MMKEVMKEEVMAMEVVVVVVLVVANIGKEKEREERRGKWKVEWRQGKEAFCFFLFFPPFSVFTSLSHSLHHLLIKRICSEVLFSQITINNNIIIIIIINNNKESQ